MSVSPQYRRKWKRTDIEKRQTAAASLEDLFHPQRLRRATMVVLTIVSLIGHAGVIAVLGAIGMGKGMGLDEVAKKDSYLRKILEKDRARAVADRVASKPPPPPPPPPEQVVSNALSASLVEDITKVTGKLLDVSLQKDLASFVKTSLQDELAAAAKNIAAGKLSEKEIEDLHKKFQEKAHQKTLEWRQDYLVQHQEERAALSTTEWYEKQVSKTLFNNIAFELWPPPGYKGHPPSPELWHNAFVGGYGWNKWLNWSDLRSDGMLREKLDVVRSLLTGKWPDAGGKHKNEHPAWPGPNQEQAKIVSDRLTETFQGRTTVTYPKPSWKAVIYGSDRTPGMTDGVLKEFFPHRTDELRPVAGKLDGQWEKAMHAAADYLQKAEAGGGQEQLAAAQTACFDAMKEILKTSEVFLPKNAAQQRAVNWVIRCEILLGPARDEAYKKIWSDELVAGLQPLIRDFARGQFKKGIIVHKDGVEQAMKEFPDTIIPLLRRDVEKTVPPTQFNDRILDTVYPFRSYTSSVTGKARLPEQGDLKAEQAEMAKIIASWSGEEKAYCEKRRPLLTDNFHAAVRGVKEAILESVLTGKLLFRSMGAYMDGVNYADNVQETLTAREMALKGRGQDMARLTTEGVPDTSAPLVALMYGASRGHGASLEPVPTSMAPNRFSVDPEFDTALRRSEPIWPKAPAKWGFVEQATVKPRFNATRFEAIPFLSQFPNLDGDLGDWGSIRPILLQAAKNETPALVYAAWNYQGFFFGCKVKERPEEFFWPSLYGVAFSLHSYVLGASMSQNTGVGWAFKGDYLHLLFDTLDARSDRRGDPHTQEFVIFPQGTEDAPDLPGIERVIESKLDATTKEWRGVKDNCRIFGKQPPKESGPDGRGPYRVTKVSREGYAMEVFMPRSLFKTPVFCPGWYIGFNCNVGIGNRGGQGWVGNGRDRSYGDRPNAWGDLLMLGTDPRMIAQEADSSGSIVQAIVPGRSYLFTIIDPDRNVSPSSVDTVLMSAEVNIEDGDAEVFILRETDRNTGIFRGYINTQPGRGREAPGLLELTPLTDVTFGYVDVADANGNRNVVNNFKLPVVTGIMTCAAKK